MNYWWTSDYHFSHFNIIRYCKRPFKTAEEMNETIIKRHNERVKPDDTVFFLGDFIFKGGKEGGVEKYKQFEKRLNGKYIFIKGNRDRNNSLKTIITKMYIHYGAKDICMTHRAEDADPACIKAFEALAGRETCFEWNEPLVRILDEGVH